MKSTRLIIASIVIALAFATAPAKADRMSDLQAQHRQRDPQIRKLKAAGKVGETAEGKLEAVNGKALDESARKLVDQDNADRQELYELIAKKQNTTPQLVAERAAKLNFDHAAPGEYLKDNSGHWAKKS